MPIYVLDAGAAIAYLDNEQGGTVVDVLVSNLDNHCFIHAVNVTTDHHEFDRLQSLKTAKFLFIR